MSYFQFFSILECASVRINQNITNICINSNNGKFYRIDPKKCIVCKNDTFMKCFEISCIINSQTGYNNLIKYE